jgi:aspartate/methionine/tyrosine aminotransferase
METFEMERMQSTYENLVDYDMSESGVRPLTLRELMGHGFRSRIRARHARSATANPTARSELREILAKQYPGATVDHIEVTNGTSEANYMLALNLLQPGDGFALEVPNYMQLWGVPRSLSADTRTFRLNIDRGWEP